MCRQNNLQYARQSIHLIHANLTLYTLVFHRKYDTLLTQENFRTQAGGRKASLQGQWGVIQGYYSRIKV